MICTSISRFINRYTDILMKHGCVVKPYMCRFIDILRQTAFVVMAYMCRFIDMCGSGGQNPLRGSWHSF